MNYPKIPEEHEQWAIEQGLCHQCIHPDCKGICSCGGWEKHKKYMDRMTKKYCKMAKKRI